MVLFALLSTVVVVLTGTACYHQGRHDAFGDVSPFTVLGAQLCERFLEMRAGDSVTIRFERHGGGRVVGAFITDRKQQAKDGHA